MKRISIVLVICVGLMSSTLVVAKVEKQNFDELLEAIYNRWEEEVAYELLQERLWEYYNDPLVLNQASREELSLLCILTDEQLDQFFNHLSENGPLISSYEIQTIPGFDLETIRLLLPFVVVEEAFVGYSKRSSQYKELDARNSYGLMRYQRTIDAHSNHRPNNKKGTAPYIGSPHHLLTRLSIKNPRGWEIGLSARKGAGEALTWDPATQHYGLATWRLHWLRRGKKKLKALVVGDYAVGYGQGVVLNAGFCMDKSSETIKVIRTNNLGIRPHTSVSITALKGLAATWQWQSIELTTYYSNVNLDGKVEQDACAGKRCVSNVSKHSYYRTQGDIAKKGKVNEQVIGSTLVYKHPAQRAELGINMLYSHYNVPIHPKISRNNPLRFRGQYHANGSIFYRYLWQNFHFLGEGALSQGGGKAALVGVVASLSRYADVTVLGRHYDQSFHSPYGKAFRENSTSNSNESGVYLGTRISPLRYLHLDAYHDYFYFPWCFGQPRAGYSWLVRANYQPTKAFFIYLQCKTTTKPRWMAKTEKVTISTRQSYKLLWQYTLSQTTSLKSEVQCSRYQQMGVSRWGYAATQDITYRVRKLRIKGHVVWFHAESANNTLYTYEPNLPHTGFNFRPHRGIGMRYGVLIYYQPAAAFRLALKYSLTHRKNQNTAGSTRKTIQSSKKNDVALQATLKF